MIQKICWQTSIGGICCNKETLLCSLCTKAKKKWEERWRRAEVEESSMLLEIIRDIEQFEEYINLLKKEKKDS